MKRTPLYTWSQFIVWWQFVILCVYLVVYVSTRSAYQEWQVRMSGTVAVS